MPAYKSELVSFEAPHDWEDKTIVAFSTPPSPGKFSPNVVLTKEALRPGETLRSYADRQIMELARRLDGFELVESGDRIVGGTPAMEYRFSWKSEQAELLQHSVIFVSRTFVLTLTGTATPDTARELDAAMGRVLDSVVLGDGGGPPAPGGGAPLPPMTPPAGGGGWTRR